MNFIARLFVNQGARTDARYQLQSADERIVSDLGLRPKLDPSNNPEHAEFVRTLGDRVRIEELREDTRRIENEAAEHGVPSLYLVGIIATLGVEAFGANLLMRSLGVESNERLILGLALALALVGLTYITSNRVASSGGGERKGVVQAAKRSLWSLLVLAIYSAVVVAIAIIRIQGSMDEEASPLEVGAQSLLLLATAVGPAWIAEWLIRKRAPAALIRRRGVLVRKELRAAEHKHSAARDAVNKITREGTRWDGEAARRRAVYQTQHRLQTARNHERPAT